jgi:hypothetical protein
MMGGGVSGCRCRSATMKFAISQCALEVAKSKSGSWPSRLGAIPRQDCDFSGANYTISEANGHGTRFSDADVYQEVCLSFALLVCCNLRPFSATSRHTERVESKSAYVVRLSVFGLCYGQLHALPHCERSTHLERMILVKLHTGGRTLGLAHVGMLLHVSEVAVSNEAPHLTTQLTPCISQWSYYPCH